MKAKAIIFVQPGKVVLDDVELPEPTASDLVIQTEVSGISVGTERWAYLGRRGDIQFPSVPGYMAVGTVLSCGPAARDRGWREGERVYYFASRFRGELEGKSWMGSHLSHAVVDVGGPRAGGGELAIHHCEKVPPSLPPEETALLGLCAVAMRGIEMAGVPAGARVLISGLGIIGQYALQVCLLKGARVTVSDIVDARLEVARKMGAHYAIHPGREDLPARTAALAPGGFDIIIDTSSVVAVVNALFPLLRMRGKFIFQGWYPPPTPLDLHALHTRLPSAYFPCAHSAEAVETAMDWAARGWVRSQPLVTHVFAPEDAARAYAMIERGSEEFLGLLFDWRKR